jgi:phosphoribosyl-ATP pyrophosphohydrolase
MTTPDQSAIALLFHGLSPAEQQELQDIAAYLSEHAATGGHDMPEQSVARLFNQASPKVREKLARLSEALETPRFAPFQEKRSVADRAGEFGLDPQVTEMVKQGLDNNDVAAQLQRKMGTDASAQYGQPDRPLSLKEQLAAALELHGGK